MKQGNQFYLELQITDSEDKLLDISSVKKVQFTIGKFMKYYDGISDEVTYDKEKNTFKIWLTEKETFKFNSNGIEKLEARILFKNDTIIGTDITSEYIREALSKEEMYVEA